MLYAVLVVVAIFLPFNISADEQVASMLPWIYGGTFGTLIVTGLMTDHKNRSRQKQLTTERQQEAKKIADRYNMVTTELEKAYESEKSSLTRSDYRWYFGPRKNTSKKALRREYENKYLNNKAAFKRELNAFQQQWKLQTSEAFGYKRYWKWLIAAGLFTQILACNYSLASMEPEETAAPSAAMQNVEKKVWNAKTIPMPHLTDGSRYVSNPDGVVTPETERQLNVMLREMDDSLGIESVVAIVNHIEDQDIFRMAQDIFDVYHVGKNDRGLVMVLAYEDHLFRTHTGRALEADLTDAECSRLQREYLVPSMKAEVPDSGMLYLTQAIYNLLRGKEMPVMSALTSPQESDDDWGDMAFYSLSLMFWAIFALYIARRYGMLALAPYFMPNPFAEQVAFMTTGGFGGGRGGGFGGGGGGFSGGFGGGSSGGGGATSSW